MYRELRISIIAILVFVLFGVQNYVISGAFVTLFFLDNVALVIIALIFLFLNLKEKGRLGVLYAFAAMLALAFADPWTIPLLSSYLNTPELVDWANQPVLIWSSFIIYFSFLFFSCLSLFKRGVNIFILMALVATIIGAIICLIWQSYLLYFILSNVFLVIYILSANSIENSKNRLSDIVSALYVALLFFNILSISFGSYY